MWITLGAGEQPLPQRTQRGTEKSAKDLTSAFYFSLLTLSKARALELLAKLGRSVFTMRHISCKRERIRSPILAQVFFTSCRPRWQRPSHIRAGSSAKFVVISVVRLSLYRG